jgi:hypothetical protein
MRIPVAGMPDRIAQLFDIDQITVEAAAITNCFLRQTGIMVAFTNFSRNFIRRDAP